MKQEFTSEERHHFNERIKREFKFPGHIMESSRVELIDSLFINVDNQPMWFYFDRNRLAPTIQNLLNYNFLKQVTITSGAAHYVELGQNIQRAMVKHLDENIKKNEIVAVKHHEWDKPLAVGMMLFDAAELMKQKEGDVIRTLHHVNDKIWMYRHSI